MRSDSQSREGTACLSALVGQCQKVHLIARQLLAPGNIGGFTPPKSCSKLIKVKPFACTECDKTYGRPDHLKRHALVHQPPLEKQVCLECQRNGESKYSFSDVDKLRRHIVDVHTGQPYALVSGESITWSKREHYINEAQNNAKPGLEEHDDHIFKLAMSFPRGNRRIGGKFTKGPLALEGEKNFPGSNAFNRRGELQPHYSRYRIIQTMLSEHKSPSQAPAPVSLRRSNRERNKVIRLPPPVFFKRSGPAKPATVDDGFTELRTNLYGVAFYNPERPRRRPECWPKDWAWPQNPTYIPEDENPCDHCAVKSNEKACKCIIQKMEARNRLSVRDCKEKGKGKGVFATARKTDKKTKWKCVFNKDGNIRVYEAHTILMPLTGTLVPDHLEYNDGWSAEIRRDDLPGAPVLGRIYCRYAGNLVRYVNHSCENNSILRWCRCSGKYTLELWTLRDIYDDEEITVNYGPDYFTKEKPCLCGSEKCVSRKQDVERDTSNDISAVVGQKRKVMGSEPASGQGRKRVMRQVQKQLAIPNA